MSEVPYYGAPKKAYEFYGSGSTETEGREHDECCPCPPASAGGAAGPLSALGGIVGSMRKSRRRLLAKAPGLPSPAEEYPYPLMEPANMNAPFLVDGSCCPCAEATLKQAVLEKS